MSASTPTLKRKLVAAPEETSTKQKQQQDSPVCVSVDVQCKNMESGSSEWIVYHVHFHVLFEGQEKNKASALQALRPHFQELLDEAFYGCLTVESIGEHKLVEPPHRVHVILNRDLNRVTQLSHHRCTEFSAAIDTYSTELRETITVSRHSAVVGAELVTV